MQPQYYKKLINAANPKIKVNLKYMVVYPKHWMRY